MDRLPLSRDRHGQLQMAGTGPVSLHVDYSDVLGKGGHGAVFSGQIIDLRDGTMLRVVSATALKQLLQRHEYSVLM